MKKLQSIDDLKPAKYNPRRISERAAKGLGKSLDKFGDLSGIVWNSKTGNLVAGHQRVEQLRQAGATFAGGVIVAPDGESFPVRVVSWSVAKEKAANVTANNQALAGEFTDDLGLVLDEIKLDLPEIEFEELRLEQVALPPTPIYSPPTGRPSTKKVAERHRDTPLVEFIEAHSTVLLFMSGGKDSMALAIWAEKNLKQMPRWVFYDTGLEWPGTREHVEALANTFGAEVDYLIPAQNEWLIYLRRYGMPSYAGSLWCRTVLKFRPMAQYVAGLGVKKSDICSLVGLRREESQKRLGMDDRATTDGIDSAHPILEMKTAEVFASIKERGLELLPVYSFLERTGCFCCPNHDQKTWQKMRTHAPNEWMRSIYYLSIAAQNADYREKHLARDLERMCYGMSYQDVAKLDAAVQKSEPG